MARGILVVRSEPIAPDREDEYNEWYSQEHLRDICATPGFVSARRYRLIDGEGLRYLAVYEIEAEDLVAARRALTERGLAGEMALSPALCMDPAPEAALYELME